MSTRAEPVVIEDGRRFVLHLVIGAPEDVSRAQVIRIAEWLRDALLWHDGWDMTDALNDGIESADWPGLEDGQP